MIDDFEQRVFAQRPAIVPWVPVTDFSFEARKAVEGPHPGLILKTFTPDRILDAGCGPGHLVRMLNEMAKHTIAFGIDVRADADYVVDLTDEEMPRLRADLVISRELLEHLTLLDIRRVIHHLCAFSTRYLYLTSRFSSESDVFHVETTDDLDPTHITIPAKDLIRLLITLEGFRRRADLETRMDWKHLNRVLVYERAI